MRQEKHKNMMYRVAELEDSMARLLTDAVSEGGRVGAERRLQDRHERQVEREARQRDGEMTKERELAAEDGRDRDKIRDMNRDKEIRRDGERMRTWGTESDERARIFKPGVREAELLPRGARDCTLVGNPPAEEREREYQGARDDARSDVGRRVSASPRKQRSIDVSWSTRSGGNGRREGSRTGSDSVHGLVWSAGRHPDSRSHLGR